MMDILQARSDARVASGPSTIDRRASLAAREAGYRRLAVAILGLDVNTLATELGRARGAEAHRPAEAFRQLPQVA